MRLRYIRPLITLAVLTAFLPVTLAAIASTGNFLLGFLPSLVLYLIWSKFL